MNRFVFLLVLVTIKAISAEPTDADIVDIKEKDKIGVMVVPKDDKRFALKHPIMQLVGTGASWDFVGGKLPLSNQDCEPSGFDLREELKTNALNMGFSANDVDTYMKEAKTFDIIDSFVSTSTFYRIGRDAKIFMDKIDKTKFVVKKMVLLGRTSDNMIEFYQIDGDLTSR